MFLRVRIAYFSGVCEGIEYGISGMNSCGKIDAACYSFFLEGFMWKNKCSLL